LLEYPQRFKCEVTGFNAKTENEEYGWHIRRCPISFFGQLSISINFVQFSKEPTGPNYPKNYEGLSALAVPHCNNFKNE